MKKDIIFSGKNIMTGLDVQYDSVYSGNDGPQCEHGCGRQDNACQVWKTLQGIRRDTGHAYIYADRETFKNVINYDDRLANRRENM